MSFDPGFHIVSLQHKSTSFITIATLIIMRMSMCLIFLGLFAGAFATPLDIVNNCDRAYVVNFLIKNDDDKFVQTMDNLIELPIATLPDGITSYDVNDTYIEFWDPYQPDVFDESGSRLVSEKFICDDFIDGSTCSKFKIPSREILYIGDIGTIFMCSAKKNDASVVNIVNNCDYEPTMFVYQSLDDKIKNFKPDVNESSYVVAQGSTTFVTKKGVLTFIEFLTDPLDSVPFDMNAYTQVFPPSKFFDDDNKPVIPGEYMCADLSPECGAYAEDKVKMIDVTAMKTLYMCSIDKKDDLVYTGRKMLLV